MESYLKNQSNLKTLDKIATTVYVALVIIIELALLSSALIGFVNISEYNLGVGLLVQVSFIATMIVVAVIATAWMVATFMLRDVAKAKAVSGAGLLLVGLFASPLILGIYVLTLPPAPLQPQPPIRVSR
jgi:hypothetical protein